MKYLGFYSSQNLTQKCKEYGTLFTWTLDGYEIIIYYDKSNPFISCLFAISVELTQTYDSYDLFEYTSSFSNDIDVKTEVAFVAQFLLSSSIFFSSSLPAVSNCSIKPISFFSIIFIYFLVRNLLRPLLHSSILF